MNSEPSWTATLFFVNDPVDHSRDLYSRTDKDGKFSLASMEPKPSEPKAY